MTDVTKSQLVKKKRARTKPSAQLLRLVPKTELEKKPCSETIESLTWLLHEAIAGRVTGIAYGATLQNKNFLIHSAGEADREPLRALGMVHSLSLDIARRLCPVQE